MDLANEMQMALRFILTNWYWILLGVLSISALVFGYSYGKNLSIRRLRRMVKKREGNHAADDFIIQPAEDGAMEVLLTRSAFKRLRNRENVEGLVSGKKGSMVFRIVRV